MVLQTVNPMGELVRGWLQNLTTSADDGIAFQKTVSSTGDTGTPII